MGKVMAKNDVPNCVIKEAFAGDFTSLRERSGLPDAQLKALYTLRENYFLQFAEYVKSFVAIEEMAKKRK